MKRQNNIFFYLSSLFVLSAVLYACSGSQKSTTQSGAGIITDSLFNSSFDLRSYNLGMAREEFDLGDDSTILENEKDLIVESISIKSTDSIFAECSYRFEHDLFQSSEINIFSPTDSINKMVSDTLEKRLNKRYGQGRQSRGFSTWRAKSKKGYALEIFMGDVSHELGSAATQIQVHAELIEKPMLAIKTTLTDH